MHHGCQLGRFRSEDKMYFGRILKKKWEAQRRGCVDRSGTGFWTKIFRFQICHRAGTRLEKCLLRFPRVEKHVFISTINFSTLEGVGGQRQYKKFLIFVFDFKIYFGRVFGPILNSEAASALQGGSQILTKDFQLAETLWPWGAVGN